MSGVPYHAWTHRPKADGGTDPIAIPPSTTVFPWAKLTNGAATTTSGTWERVKCHYAWSYNEVAAGYALGDVFQFTDNGDYWDLTLDMDGLYLVDGIFTWANSFPEYRTIHLSSTTGDYNPPFEYYGLTTHTGPFTSIPGGTDFYTVDTLHTFIFKSSSVSGPKPVIDPRAKQLSGSNRDISAESIRVIYLGDIGAEASWFFQST